MNRVTVNFLVDTVGLVGGEGSSLCINGCATVNLHLGDCEIKIYVIVASPLITDAILGINFPRRQKAWFDILSQ